VRRRRDSSSCSRRQWRLEEGSEGETMWGRESDEELLLEKERGASGGRLEASRRVRSPSWACRMVADREARGVDGRQPIIVFKVGPT
jgi:hypothetical protein